MTNFVMSWRTFDVMTCFWRHDVFDFIKYFTWHTFLTSWRIFWRHYAHYELFNVCLTSWGTFLTSWGTCWRHDELFDALFDVMMHFLILWCVLTSWRTFWSHDVMMHFLILWCVLTSWRTFWRHDELFEVMTNFLRHFLTSWWTLWRHDKPFDVITYFSRCNVFFLRHDELFDLMTNFLTSWRLFLTSLRVFQVITCFSLHYVFFTS